MRKIQMRIMLAGCFTCCALIANGFSVPPKPVKPPIGGNHGAPFDGGASLLVAAGVAYGVKKAYNKRTAKTK
jgi:hypothetical protein